VRALLPLLLLACVEPAPPRVVPDPGPPPHEAPPAKTLWRGDQPVARVLAATPDGAAHVDLEGRLHLRASVVADHVLPQLSTGPRGLAFTRSPRPPRTDVWLAGRDVRPITTDGRSDRPFQLPDGTLLWISSAGGQAHWVREGQPLTRGGPVPAYPAKTRFEDGWIRFDTGDGWRRLDPETGVIKAL